MSNKIKQKFGDSYDKFVAMLSEEDPIGIVYEDVGNFDEYEAEVQSILPRLSKCKSINDIQNVIYDEFCFYFTLEIAGPITRYRKISERVFNELKNLLPNIN